MPVTTIARGRAFTYLDNMGRFANSETGFQHPVDVARRGEILYIANASDEYNYGNRITKMTLDHEWIQDIGIPFPGGGAAVQLVSDIGDGQFLWPGGIALDRDENVFVTDQPCNSIVMFKSDGTFLGKWGVLGSGDGEFDTPSGIAFDESDNLYIADTKNHRVERFTKDGRFLGKFGRYGKEAGEFDQPWGICLDKEGNIYVTDWGNDRVQKFSADGEHLATFGGSGTGKRELLRPSDVAVDKDGDVYIADWGNNRVNVYEANGDYLASLVGEARDPSPWYQLTLDANPDLVKGQARADMEPDKYLRRPTAVDVGDDYKIVIVESRMHRMQIYQKDPEYGDVRANI